MQKLKGFTDLNSNVHEDVISRKKHIVSTSVCLVILFLRDGCLIIAVLKKGVGGIQKIINLKGVLINGNGW